MSPRSVNLSTTLEHTPKKQYTKELLASAKKPAHSASIDNIPFWIRSQLEQLEYKRSAVAADNFSADNSKRSSTSDDILLIAPNATRGKQTK